MGWLLRDDQVLARLEIADAAVERARGLLGRDGLDGALLLRPALSVHTVGVRFPIDVAYLDAEGAVVDLVTMSPWRIGRPRLSARQVVEAEAGSFARWGVHVGDRLEVRS